MYQKYTTEAVVLKVYPRGEADQQVACITRDFGVLYARATGARKEKSLMRYALIPGAYTHVSLVRGKRGWRLTGTLPNVHIEHAASAHAFARIAGLVVRLVHGEGQNDFLFETIKQSVHALMRAREERVPEIELLAVARVLYALGYLSPEAVHKTLFAHTDFTPTVEQEVQESRVKILGAVNSAIAASQL